MISSDSGNFLFISFMFLGVYNFVFVIPDQLI